MNYSDFVQGISFRFYQPSMYPLLFKQLSKLLGMFGYSLEIINTNLPVDSKEMKERLSDICQIPRMSTYAVAAMINAGVSQMSDKHCFVNVGVWHGFTLLAGMVKNPGKTCIGVDNFSEFGGPREQFNAGFKHFKSENHFFYDMDYQEYFAKVHKGLIGVYIYDGEHSYENQLNGLKMAEPFFAKDCIVLVDDTNLKAPRWALDDFIAQSPYKYKVILDKSTYDNLHPTLWNGIIILQRIG